ncbi:adenosylmethionine--8-amino-7-oxononanoate aminotransferase [Candidatus Gastranaerophilus sp. (ex Termes propinquus)]|nr:adenosylmethionine--8-amino-7-oxononanoate aminotransferase [Candidatus Gastranaerophilus sp. (ex Termes propinquus)]
MNWLEKDLKYVWHPFTQMKEHSPILIERAKGVWLYDDKGKKYIDGISSWWVNTLGHSNDRLNKVLYEQAQTMEHVIFSGFTHKSAIELAEKLVELTCPRLTKVFYSDNGSTAVEVALKMAYQYQVHKGKPEKCKFIAFENSYHGDTIGAVSVGGVDLYHKVYKPLLFEIFQGHSPYCYRCPVGKAQEECACECLGSTEEILKMHSNEIAGVIIEPLVQCAGGMIMYPPKHLVRLRELCDKYGVFLILDEVATGFYRTGKLFAYEHAGIEPDIMCIAKGITAGYMPLSVTLASDEIYNAFYDEWDKFKTFFHGHSYTANPLAVRIAVENLKILEEENIAHVVEVKSKLLKSELEKLRSLPYVGDVRTAGMIGAIELVGDKRTKESFESSKRIGMQVYRRALELGALLRPLGDVIYFMPPYIINEDELKSLVSIARQAIEELKP